MAIWKVRMTVLVMVSANNDIEAKLVANEVTTDAGLVVLHTEEPDLVPPKATYGSAEGDIYP